MLSEPRRKQAPFFDRIDVERRVPEWHPESDGLAARAVGRWTGRL